MSVYIRGIEMPKSCSDCPMCYDMMECTVSNLRFWSGSEELRSFDFCAERAPLCPLIELPPHGRLIDADELEERWTAPPEFYPNDYSKSVYDNGKLRVKDFRASVIDAPTIIPAEEV